MRKYEAMPDAIAECARLPSYEETETATQVRYLDARIRQAQAEKPEVGWLMIRMDAAEKIKNLLRMSEAKE